MQFVETEMGNKIDPKIINLSGGFVPMEMVVKGKSINFFVLSFSLAKKWLVGMPVICRLLNHKFVKVCFIF